MRWKSFEVDQASYLALACCYLGTCLTFLHAISVYPLSETGIAAQCFLDMIVAHDYDQ